MKNRNVSPALRRLLGSIGFLIGGLGFFSDMNSVLGLGVEPVGFSSLGWKGWLLPAVSVVVSIEAWVRLNTNAIESAFSQAKNRIWAVGKPWNEEGLMNWIKVVKKIFFPNSWNRLWSEYLDLDLELDSNLMGVRYQWV